MIERRLIKGTSIFLIFQKIIESELKDIEEYINETASDLKAKQEKLGKDYEEANKYVEEESEYNVHSFFEDDIHKYLKVFPVYTYNPLLLTLYGQFENWLKQLCDLDSRKGFSKVRVKDLSGNNYIEKSRRYLELVAEINLDDTKVEWEKITQIQKLRNCIAHNDSNIIKDKSMPIEKQGLYNIVSKDNSLEFDEAKGDFYIKEPEFLLGTIELIKKYLVAVIDKIEEKKVVAKNMFLPYENTSWGQEKAEVLLKQVISALNLLDKNETLTDEYKDSDLKCNLRGTFESMTFNLTKLYSFFGNGKWEVVDQKYIVDEREKGLEKVKNIYDIK